jgi:hypothetical protein
VTAPVVEPPSPAPPTRETRTDTSSREAPAIAAVAAVPVPAKPAPAPRPTVKKAGSGREIPRTVAVPAVAEDVAGGVEEERPPWEDLAGDTENFTSRADTAPTKRRTNAELTRQKLAELQQQLVAVLVPLSKRKWFWWAVGAGGLVLLILLVWWALSPSRPRATATAPREPLAVFATDRGGAAESLRARLRAAKNGDVIEINDDIIADITTEANTAKNLTIQGRAGKTVVWRCTAGGTKLLTLKNAAGTKLRNLIFDGEGKIDSLVTLFGASPGLTLENVTFRGFRRYAVWIVNCVGSADQPVTLTASRFTTTKADQAAIYFDINTSIAGISKDEYIAVREDCTFGGPGAKVRAREPGLTNHLTFPDDTFARGL